MPKPAVNCSPIVTSGNWLFPTVLALLAFLVMYTVIPFTRVRFGSAMVGALSAAILWESGKGLFAASIGQSVRFSTIYGSIAAIPIFLVWLYITWIIVLGGLEISFTYQHSVQYITEKVLHKHRSI